MNGKALLATLYWRKAPLSSQEYQYLCDKLFSPEKTSKKEILKQLEQLSQVTNSLPLKSFLQIEPDWWKEGYKELLWCKKNKISTVCFAEEDYPVPFYTIPKPPLILTYQGHVCWKKPNLSIVGSRQPSAETHLWLNQNIPLFLKEHKVTLVSGGARGVDQQAHSIAIRNKTPTLCVLPSGLNHVYPSSLHSWFEAIFKHKGAVISSYSPFTPMRKGQFHYRNSLIAGLSSLTFIAEARRKSGSLITAKMALNTGKDISVLPCSPTTNSGLGGLDLIFEGGHFCRDYKDLIMQFESSTLNFQKYKQLLL